MGTINKIKKFKVIRTYIGFIIIGLIMAVVAIFIQFQPSRETAKVNATIIDIEESTFGDSEEYHVWISYEVNGKQYTTDIGAHVSGWKVGDVIECDYDIENPEIINYGNGKIVVIVVMVVGIIAVVYGIFMIVKNAKKPSDDYSQYNRINEDEIDQSKREEVENNTEEKQEYVFHFTGKLNQSYVMKDRYDNEVFKADCGGITIVKATDFNFVNVRTGSSKARKIGHTVTSSIDGDASIFANISSSFKIDGENCWDFLKNMGYGFNFSLNGLKSHYEVYHQGVNVGSIEIAGTEVMNKKYEGNALAKLPTNGIFRISCQPSEVEGFFYICFCITKTEPTID